MLSVVIPTRNKASRLRLCLQTLVSASAQEAPDFEVIVVDDGSEDTTSEVLEQARRALEPRFKALRFRSPRGRASARNAGAGVAVGERLLFLDDDILIEAASLQRHSVAARGALAPILARASILNLPWLRYFEDPLKPGDDIPPRLAARAFSASKTDEILAQARSQARRSPFEADLQRLLDKPGASGRWLASTGGNLSMDRELFASLGGFDPQMGLHWGVEDLELGYRAESRGGQVVYLSDLAVYHMDHPTTQRANDHAINLRYFSSKHGEALGRRLTAYFEGKLDIEEVVG